MKKLMTLKCSGTRERALQRSNPVSNMAAPKQETVDYRSRS